MARRAVGVRNGRHGVCQGVGRAVQGMLCETDAAEINNAKEHTEQDHRDQAKLDQALSTRAHPDVAADEPCDGRHGIVTIVLDGEVMLLGWMTRAVYVPEATGFHVYAAPDEQEPWMTCAPLLL